MPDADLGVSDLLALAVADLGGQNRPGQQQMAAAVTQTLADGGHLLVQAGTGTGKSLAYLIPALHHASLTGQRLVVATATLALQRQIMAKDLPLAGRALVAGGLAAPVAALLKGRSNYLCRHKLAGGYPDEDVAALFAVDAMPGVDAPVVKTGVAKTGAAKTGAAKAGLASQVKALHAWAQETSTGDRDDAPEGTGEAAWRQVSVRALECLGQRCPLVGECFAEQARSGAAQADLVVTNHALLALHALADRPILPEFDGLIVDEAHELANRFTAAASMDLSEAGVQAAVRAAKAAGVVAEQLAVAGDFLGSALGQPAEGRLRDGLPEELGRAVQTVRSAARTTLSQLGASTAPSQPNTASGAGTGGAGTGAAGAAAAEGARQSARAAAEALFEAAEAMLAATPGQDVLWLARPGRAGQWGLGQPALHMAPLTVSGLIRHRLLAQTATVLTSATLTLGGDFMATAHQIGLNPADRQTITEKTGQGSPSGRGKNRPPAPASDPSDLADPLGWQGLDVGSPFDYRQQGICYIAADLPAPGRDGVPAQQQHQLLAELITAAGGRTLALFSSRRAAEAAAEAVADLVEVPILCQGEQSTAALVAEFVADPPTCLFGTLSLWQGVDAPGPTCSLVTIDRLPFPRPDDPISAARQEAAGAGGFLAVAASHAALLLAQGAGRLIRGPADRGVVAVLDPRLATARYGPYLRASLPPLWITTNRQITLDALRRLTQP